MLSGVGRASILSLIAIHNSVSDTAGETLARTIVT